VLLNLARSRRVLFFGGKGGVGKTTVASATALALANGGARVLLVSTDPAHNLGHLWSRPVGPEPVQLAPGLRAMELDPAETVARHLQDVTANLRRLMPVHLGSEVDRHMALARDAPGMAEAALLERMAELAAAREPDEYLIFDTAPTGHTVQLLALPELMAAWTDGLLRQRDRAERLGERLRRLADDRRGGSALFGSGGDAGSDRDGRIRELLNRRRARLAGLRQTLVDQTTTAFVMVLTAERLPVLETIELHASLTRLGVPVGGMVVNKRIPPGLGDFMETRRQQESQHLQALRAALPETPLCEVFMAARDIVGREVLTAFASALRDD
jgi:arsenite-transporting ATPase